MHYIEINLNYYVLTVIGSLKQKRAIQGTQLHGVGSIFIIKTKISLLNEIGI